LVQAKLEKEQQQNPSRDQSKHNQGYPMRFACHWRLLAVSPLRRSKNAATDHRGTGFVRPQLLRHSVFDTQLLRRFTILFAPIVP
jgi:hypothetical protein